MTERPLIDPKILKFGEATDRQTEIIEAINEKRGITAAAKALGICRKTVWKAKKAVENKAARKGYAPGVFEIPVAPGFILGKVTTQLGADGQVERMWPRQSPEAAEIVEQLREFVEGLKDEVPDAVPVLLPSAVAEDMATSYHITDYHIGMLAHAIEGDGVGADWNLEIAEDLLVRLITYLSAKSPDSATAFLCLMGDLLHFDGPDAVTPTHRHPLDASNRQVSVVRVTSRVLKRVIRILLERHAKVVVICVEGNHDLSSTPWVREILRDHFESEPRVEVLDQDLPYQAVEFGATMIGVTHGHKRRKETLGQLFAAMFRAMFGRTKTLVIHTGHLHSGDEKDFPGGRVIQHRTATAPDSHALRGGWLSEREMAAFHYHRRYGPQGRHTCTPEMVGYV